jgi:Fe(3+) dicitrate transport protein
VLIMVQVFSSQLRDQEFAMTAQKAVFQACLLRNCKSFAISNLRMSIKMNKNALSYAFGLCACAMPFMATNAQAEMAAAAPETIVVVGQRDNLLKIAGTGATIEQADLVKARVFTVNDALRQVSGVYARDEEGLGLRPNIGIRGLSPTRSGKVLLLEDGIPLGYAPYGDNAAYYHPSIRRFSRIEVLKGASQVRFGPNTIGGVINYVTPAAPEAFEGKVTIAGGSRGYGELDLELGSPVLGARALFHGTAAQSEGARDNQNLTYNDLYLKLEYELGEHHDLTWRVSRYSEDSQITYSGLTQTEYLANPRQNPFKNDRFTIERATSSLQWAWALSDSMTLKTTGYVSWFDRDWWRQSSNSGQRPNDASDPACGGLANLLTTCGNEGRLREYNTHGIETRLSHVGAFGDIAFNSEVGIRYADERQNRLQINSDTPNGRTPGTGVNGGLRENNLRYVKAWSGFATTKATLGKLTVSPGVRVENIEYERVNRLNPLVLIQGNADVSEVIPGIGVTYELAPSFVAYGGVHRGFAPPRVEDAISNTTGSSINLDAEISTNWEAGVRGALGRGVSTDLAWFRMDFDNQIVPNSVAGGAGSTLTSAGKTLHQGIEASARGSFKDMGIMADNDVYFRVALTWLADARYEGARFSAISGQSTRSVSGNRLPYAPEVLFNAALGYEWTGWGDMQLEYVFTDQMYTDDLNTVAPTADGQRGLIPASSIWNATLNIAPADWKVGFYVTVRNILDEDTIVDRARGILPGSPRLVQAGITARF